MRTHPHLTVATLVASTSLLVPAAAAHASNQAIERPPIRSTAAPAAPTTIAGTGSADGGSPSLAATSEALFGPEAVTAAWAAIRFSPMPGLALELSDLYPLTPGR